ncbi:MAG: GntR family transcriptional regulator [Eubacterium sp.]|nr:GntR family transcriptional regulator [Eubacterium sp.]
MAWKLDSSKPIYIQLIEVLEGRIVSGDYQPGQKIPSVRELAGEAGVNPNTMQKALVELESKGMIVTNRTSGRYVTENTKVLDSLKNSNADEFVEEFIKGMKGLGFSEKDIREIVDSHLND